ncbi:MAG: NADH:flavin oxidoreductase [Firmicutes bacterium]|nr:NADH:flavin oxidoreductase [Bacillota bacterium]
MIKEPFRFGHMELKNRLVMPPMATYYCDAQGQVTDKILDYYGARAKGGNIGLIIVEHAFITQVGMAKKNQLSISRDSDVEGLKKLTAVIKQSGSRVMAQLNHGGAAALSEASGMKPISPSPVVLPEISGMGDPDGSVEMTKEQIAELPGIYVAAARRAKEAGFDGVVIHCAHSYLLNEFYSPLTNKRTDEYGGSLDNRLRIHREVIKAVREEVGPDYTVSIRLGGVDYGMEGGNTFEDAAYAAKVFAEAGVDAIDISGGMSRYMRKGHDEPGYFQDTSRAVKAAVDLPVILTGGVRSLEQAEELLQTGAADLIGVGRPLLADPDWADKAMAEYAG